MLATCISEHYITNYFIGQVPCCSDEEVNALTVTTHHVHPCSVKTPELNEQIEYSCVSMEINTE